jgi:hypothetical protein
MPHLTSSALQDDPEGLAFLRSVLASGTPAHRPSRSTAVRPAASMRTSPQDLGARTTLPSLVAPLDPPTRTHISSHHARES